MSRPRPRGGAEDQGAAPRWTRHTVTDDEAGRTLQEILTGSLGVSRRMIQRLTRAAGIRLNGRAAYLKRAVRAGDVVAARLTYEEEPALDPVAMPLVIRYEDGDVLVVDKPAGLLVHPVGRGGEATLAHGVAHHLDRAGVRARVRPVHRLDRDTSGLVLFAKSAHVHQALDRQLREGVMRRSYLAFVAAATPLAEGLIDAPIGPHPRDPNLRSVVAAGGDSAVTRYRTLRTSVSAAMLEIELETGRTHQIRVHLAHLGHPLLGDVRYGGRPGPPGRQALHAARLSFDHPRTGERIDVRSPLPEELAALVL